ncbi:DUF5058 family protein [Alteribacillus sp. HJP-4]|uniref:DUF5058 family protein n=1 Tax=Alteribacillus sp. HJP-4 TaxID=2775394 RepID=UPI0035CCD896
MQEVMSTANSSPLWILAFLVVSIVIFQAVIFLNIASKTAPNIGMSKHEVNSSIKTGFISSLGPSFAIAIIVVSLLTLIGSPITLMRIGIIGSAATESGAAGIGADVFGADLGGENFSNLAFTNVVWTMCLGGTGWLIFTALFTKSLGNIQKKVVKKNAKAMGIVSTAAMLGVFGYLASAEMSAGTSQSAAAIISGVSMAVMMWLASSKKVNWLKEWALGIALVIGMTGGYLTSIF